MESCKEKEFRFMKIQWFIKNFKFCWHKTGERLISPAFYVQFLKGTIWRLWLYPRGEDDGEYMSFFLFREEGGPEVVHVDFELCFYIKILDERSKQTLKGQPFKIHQRQGIKCFAPRCDIIPQKACTNGSYILLLECKIFNPKSGGINRILKTFYMTIVMERIHGTEICDNVTDIEPNCYNDIEVKPMLENEPLINIKLSYFEDNLVIKILPVNCKKIKYAICKVTVINNGGKESAMLHARSWIGEIKADTCRYHVPHPEAESFKSELKTLPDITFFMHYDFAFSTGGIVFTRGKVEYFDGYLMTENVSFQQYLNAKKPKFAPTALDALEENYRTQSFTDILLKSKCKTYSAHKAILCSRSPCFKSAITENDNEVTLRCIDFNYEDLFWFLYTDKFTISLSSDAYGLYLFSLEFGLELLKTQMRNFFVRNITHFWATDMLYISVNCKDSVFEKAVENYIMTHYDYVLSEANLEQYRHKIILRKKLMCILLKCKKQKTIL